LDLDLSVYDLSGGPVALVEINEAQPSLELHPVARHRRLLSPWKTNGIEPSWRSGGDAGVIKKEY
jgi:hypothetical protein